jgi:cation diffusion facilitator CzcD-associated flavoprotein CzcO
MSVPATAELPRHARVAIVGSGFAGLGMAIRLKQSGREDFVVLERAGDVGGTWRANTYPGAACDVPSRLYSFSFAPKHDWTRSFSPQNEILDYLRDCARDFGVLPHLRLNCKVEQATWDEDARRWTLQTTDGEMTADVLVSGAGALSEPKLPPIDGVETFTGKVFHSAEGLPAHAGVDHPAHRPPVHPGREVALQALPAAGEARPRGHLLGP